MKTINSGIESLPGVNLRRLASRIHFVRLGLELDNRIANAFVDALRSNAKLFGSSGILVRSRDEFVGPSGRRGVVVGCSDPLTNSSKSYDARNYQSKPLTLLY